MVDRVHRVSRRTERKVRGYIAEVRRNTGKPPATVHVRPNEYLALIECERLASFGSVEIKSL